MDQLEQFDMNGKPIKRPKHHGERRAQISAGIWPKVGVGVVLAAAIAGIGFYGGVQYQKGHQTSVMTASTNGNGQFQGQSGFGGGRRFSNGAIGSVTAINSSSITVNDQRTDSSKTYAITSATTISDNQQTVDYSDIKVGDTVFVTASSSSTSDATRIIVNPQMMQPLDNGSGSSSGGTSTDGSGSTTNGVSST
jgi:hypothetical protein